MKIIFSFLVISVSFLWGCAPTPTELKTGPWRGVIELQGQQMPFNFEISKTNTKFVVHLINGEERLLQDEVHVTDDSITIVMFIFDIELRARISDNTLTGYYYKNYDKEFKLPFTATYGDTHRFTKSDSSTTDFSGKYALAFKSETEDYASVGIFNQKENHITGTFLTPTGDYRFLEGSVVNDTLKLSTFDGNHAFLFTATLSGDSIMGDFYSGRTSHEKWQGVKDEHATIPDAETLTFLLPGYDRLEFNFPDLKKNPVSPDDDRFKDKVLILQIFGSWCPNCMDETKFLAAWYKENNHRGVEILGLAYERKNDFSYASRRVEKMKEKLNVDYDFVIAGTHDKAKAAETLPALNHVLSFPTLIFIGKDGKVKYIHTGFSGPGTGIYYEQFKQRFNEIVNGCLAEQPYQSNPPF